jgi:hypothetical protein
VALDDGLERQAEPLGPVVDRRRPVDVGDRALRLEQRSGRQVEESLGARRPETDAVEELFGDLLRVGRGHRVVRRARLRDRAVEQPLGDRHGEERANAHAAGRLSEDGDVARIAAEAGDVVAHPLERGDLVEHPRVGGEPVLVAEQVVEAQVAKRAQSVVDRDDDHVTRLRQSCAVVPGHRAAPGLEATAVDPHHDRAGPVVGPRRVHVEEQAVLRRLLATRTEERLHPADRLAGDGAEGRALAHALPALVRRRGHEAARARRCRRERDAAELQHPLLLESAELACSGGDGGAEHGDQQ